MYNMLASGLRHVQFCNPIDCNPSGSLSMEFPRQEYWSGLPFASSGDLPSTRIKPAFLASPPLAGRFFTAVPPGKPCIIQYICTYLIVQLLTRVWLFETPWTTARQAHLSSTIFRSLLKLMSTESMMLYYHLILCCHFSSCLQSFQALRLFPMNQLFLSGGQSIGTSVSASALPMNIQGWFPLGLTALIFLQTKRLSSVFSSTTVRKHQFFWHSAFFLVQPSHLYVTSGKARLPWWLRG